MKKKITPHMLGWLEGVIFTLNSAAPLNGVTSIVAASMLQHGNGLYYYMTI